MSQILTSENAPVGGSGDLRLQTTIGIPLANQNAPQGILAPHRAI